MNAADRFWAKVDGGDVDDCWLWTARTLRGYSYFMLRDGVAVIAHRYAYEQTIGPIPEGLDLDHVCRERSCVNPWHLEPVTRSENLRRGYAARGVPDRCAQGHPYTPENTRPRRDGGRQCRECARQYLRDFRAKKKSEAAAVAIGSPGLTWPNPKGTIPMSVWDLPELKVGGEFVKFEAIGDAISGTISAIRAHRFDDGSVAPQILLVTDDGEERTVTAGQVRLKSALAEQRPEAGDHITIKLADVEKRTGGKTLKIFDVSIRRAGAPASAAAATPAAAAPAAVDQTALAAAMANLTAEQKAALGIPA